MTLAKVKLDVGDEGEDSVMINVVIVYVLVYCMVSLMLKEYSQGVLYA